MLVMHDCHVPADICGFHAFFTLEGKKKVFQFIPNYKMFDIFDINFYTRLIQNLYKNITSFVVA
jgi:hypothetical protein